MMIRSLFIVRVSAIIAIGAVTSAAGADAGQLPKGTWDGGGRSCYGKLVITAKTLTWKSAFSRCGPTPYKVVAIVQKTGEVDYHLHLATTQASCLYRDVTIMQRLHEEHWDVVGFSSPEDQVTEALNKGLVCPVYKRDN